MKKLLIILGALVLALGGALAYMVFVPPECPAALPEELTAPTLWSLNEGPYEYVGDETIKIFDTIYEPKSYAATGQCQMGNIAIICMMGVPLGSAGPLDREAWCLPWYYDADTDTWTAGKPYPWGTLTEYSAWRKEVGLD